MILLDKNHGYEREIYMKKIKKFLLGRATIVAFAIVVQLSWILSFLLGFRQRYTFLNTIIDLIAIFVVLVIVNKRSNPSYKIAWTVVILAVPMIGLLVYFIFGRSDLTRPTRKRMEAINQEMELLLPENQAVMEKLAMEDKTVYQRLGQISHIREYNSKILSHWGRNVSRIVRGTGGSQTFYFYGVFYCGRGIYVWQNFGYFEAQGKIRRGCAFYI